MDPIITGSLISLIPSLFSLLFGGGSNKSTQKTTTTTDNPNYQSASTAWLDPILNKMLLGNMNRLQGWGWPSGMGNLGIGGNISDVLALIEKEWPSIMQNVSYGGGGCNSSCRQQYPNDALKRNECYAKCKKQG